MIVVGPSFIISALDHSRLSIAELANQVSYGLGNHLPAEVRSIKLARGRRTTFSPRRKIELPSTTSIGAGPD